MPSLLCWGKVTTRAWQVVLLAGGINRDPPCWWPSLAALRLRQQQPGCPQGRTLALVWNMEVSWWGDTVGAGAVPSSACTSLTCGSL